MNYYLCRYRVIDGNTSSASSQIRSITSLLALRRLGPGASATRALRCAPDEAFVGVGLPSALRARGEGVLACIPSLCLSGLDTRGTRRVHWGLARHDDICRLGCLILALRLGMKYCLDYCHSTRPRIYAFPFKVLFKLSSA